MEQFIKNLIKNKIALYKKSYDEMLGDYNGELETIAGYNGRQLLELLQNCDDEGSKEVFISIDQSNKTISIANNGQPFSEKGYRSLFKPNLSAKKSRPNYIGNKGLGFRSIINWSDAIEVRSNNLALIYSEVNRVNRFNELFNPEIQHEIRLDQNLSDDIVPMPFLILPEIKEIPTSRYVTTIVIHYKVGFYKDIIDQVKDITAETLLFLNHIETVKFSGFDGINDIHCLKAKLPVKPGEFVPIEKMVNGDLTWFVFEDEGLLPYDSTEEKKERNIYYQIKIAIEKDLKKSVSRLYSFFPTNIYLNQPYILHATFDLDSNRKQINDSKKNKYILEKIADFTVKVARYYAAEEISYKPLTILSHLQQSDSLRNLGYYLFINNAINEQPLFPCIDRGYKRISDVIYISDTFANLVLKIGGEFILNNHLIPFCDSNFSGAYWFPLVRKSLDALEEPVRVINDMAAMKMDDNSRSLLIGAVIAYGKFIKTKSPNSLNILRNGKDQIIEGREFIYTPATNTAENKKMLVPTFTKIQFINRNLFIELLRVLDYAGDESKSKDRFIYEQLTGFCNIHSYEPTTLSGKIINETNKLTKNLPLKKASVFIKEMNACLFNNFGLMDDETKKRVFKSNAQCITLNGRIRPADELVLSAFYPTGKKTALVFDGIYGKEQFIGAPHTIGLPVDADPSLAEAYVKWLNVNSFANYFKVIGQNGLENYFRFVMGNSQSTGYKIVYKRIVDFESILKQIDIYKLLLWVHFDQELRTQMSDERNGDDFQNFYRVYHHIYEKPSYLKFQIATLYPHKFYNLLIDEKYAWSNDFQLDYQNKLFLENGLTKLKLNEILVLLGAKQEFNQLSINRVRQIINKIPAHFSDGKKSQSLYKKALGHYKEHKGKLNSSLSLFADNGNDLKPYPNNQVFFSDRIKLPKQLRKQFPVFNFPSRAGGADAIEFFGIRDLKDISMQIVDYKELVLQNEEFDFYLNKLKPIILTRRINSIDEDSPRKAQASICSKLTIKLCSEIKYSVESEIYEVAEYEFIHFNEFTYYVRIKDYDKLSNLRRNQTFLDSFADIITLSFDLSGEKNDFKYLLRSNLEDMLADTRLDFGEDTYKEARELLGLADDKQAFWQAIFKVMGTHYDFPLDDLALGKFIFSELGVEFDPQSLDYENLIKEHELLKIKSFFNQLGLSLSAFARVFQSPISFATIHQREIKDVILSKKMDVKAMIWHDLSHRSIAEQALFLHRINQFEHFEEFAAEQATLMQHQFTLDREAIMATYFSKIYGQLDTIISSDPESEKKKNVRRFTKDELYDINQSERWKSLIYFTEALPVIAAEIADLHTSIKQINEEYGESQESLTIEILESDLLYPIDLAGHTRKRPVFTPKDAASRRSKEIGNRSEDIVLDYLSRHFENVYPASRDNEGLHYDIRYKNAEGTIKFVEVKTFDHGSFHLTREQYDFGTQNKEDFEIWLVHHNQTLIPIFDFFTNPKYILTPNEYLVHLKLINNLSYAQSN